MTNFTSFIKHLLIDLLMLIFFLFLASFTIWVIWMYFFRGPIDIETRGYVSETLKEMVIQPSDTERYTLQHFHNLDDIVLKGIEYPSTCIICHDAYPHNKNPKVRSFFNAHSWFIACEVCHVDNSNKQNVFYRWLDNDTDIALYKLIGEPGIYEARIVPYNLDRGTEQRLDNAIDEINVANYLSSKDSMSEDENKEAIDKLHNVLNEKPVFCDQCHTEDSILKFKDLLYSENKADQLKTLEVGSMVKGYDVFHLPKMLRK